MTKNLMERQGSRIPKRKGLKREKTLGRELWKMRIHQSKGDPT